MFTSYVDEFLKHNSLNQLVNDLKKYAHYFIAIIHKCPDYDFEASFNRFRQLDVNTAIPLVLYLFDRYESRDKGFNISKSLFLNMLNIIESFILRRSVLRESTRGYGLDFALACEKTGNLYSFMQYFAEKGWPTDQQLRDSITGFQFYRREQKKCRLVLKELELSFGHKEKIDLSNQRIQIEHVMPQNLNFKWREMLGENADELHEKYIHTLGNLTLTGYNIDLSNKPFKEKRRVYQESNFQLNSYFDNCKKWTDKEIVKRTKLLTEIFIEIWPRPSEINKLSKKTVKKHISKKIADQQLFADRCQKED